MKTNVSTLLREFPKVRRAALSGEEVIIVTREGNLRLSADRPSGTRLIGAMRGQFGRIDDEISTPTTTDEDWKASM